ncbi:MAG: sugar kinase [Chloroflexi bacterium]|nr:sugar kinase [Chloroflexota bacterium]
MTNSGEALRNRTRPVRVVCIGETMLMFAPPPYETIEYCDHFVALNGGAESNVAIGLERLGAHAGWIGKLPRNALGRKIVNEIRSFGVDTSAVVWAERGRVGTFFVEWGAPPRPVMTIYDRAGSVATTMTADDLDWDYIEGAEWVQLTGITPAISPVCRAAVPEIARRARERGVRVAFDVNYRALLWTKEEARAACAEILPFVNLLITTEPDMAIVLGAREPREEGLRALVERYGLDAAVMTLGGEGCLAYDGWAFYAAPAHSVQMVNRLGAGDAFTAGLLYGCLEAGLEAGLRYGMAMAALKLTIPQNIPLVNKEDVERLVAGQRNADVVR